MADTKRSVAELLVMFADLQAKGNITEQDLRDLIMSYIVPWGCAVLESNATATTIATAGVLTPILGTYSTNPDAVDMSATTAGVVTYDGVPDRHFHIVANVDVTVGSNNQVVKFQWHKNGSPISIPMENKVSAGVDIQSLAIHADITLSTGDTLQLYCTNETSTAAITVKNMYNFVMGMVK